MIKNPELIQTMEDDLARSQAPDYFRNLRIFEALYQEARLLGILPLRDPWMALTSISAWRPC